MPSSRAHGRTRAPGSSSSAGFASNSQSPARISSRSAVCAYRSQSSWAEPGTSSQIVSSKMPSPYVSTSPL
ncbi:hypothetical protein [Streptomyces sp. NPDC096030]|uniref:hypothetical protein n=1 Tax=Streptomyces sp. NPDC096030 TaxID=3155423 RepID=UPI00332543B1